MKIDRNPEKRMKSLDQLADHYFGRYRSVMESFEHNSLKARFGLVESYDYVVLGEMLESYDAMKDLFETTGGTISSMGILPSIAYDVISVVYGNSPISLIASVQPVDEATGRVYLKTIKSATAKAAVTDGQIFIDPRQIGSIPKNFSAGRVSGEILATADGANVTFTTSTDFYPIRNTLNVTLEGSETTIYCKDDGDGNLLGEGVSGSIDYDTKVVVITFNAIPTNLLKIYGAYNIDYEKESDIPKIKGEYASIPVTCFPFALKAEIGVYTQYSMNRRFKFSLKDDMAIDLAAEMNLEIMGRMIIDATADVPAGNKVTYHYTHPTGVSDIAHRMFFTQSVIDLENLIAASAGRGGVSGIIAGTTAAGIIAGHPDFKDSGDRSKSGINVYGTLKDKVVIRVNDPTVLDPTYALTVWKGSIPWDAALYYAPYMAIMVTDLLPQTNPLRNQRGAASWSAQGSLIPNFLGQITVAA